MRRFSLSHTSRHCSVQAGAQAIGHKTFIQNLHRIRLPCGLQSVPTKSERRRPVTQPGRTASSSSLGFLRFMPQSFQSRNPVQNPPGRVPSRGVLIPHVGFFLCESCFKKLDAGFFCVWLEAEKSSWTPTRKIGGDKKRAGGGEKSVGLRWASRSSGTVSARPPSSATRRGREAKHGPRLSS